MKYIDEYRDGNVAQQLATEITKLSEGNSFKFMEVCGGHTHTIFKHGIEDILPDNIELIHGPGCPVCVLPMGRIDDAIAIAKTEGTIFTTFGDMMRVPGSEGSLLDIKAAGADVRFIYSPLDALKIAKQNPEREVVFFAIGFETTAPSTAVALLQAQAENIQNFSIFCNHVAVIPVIRAILDSPDLQLEGFIGPGHVSIVIGLHVYEFIARDYQKPVVISGFEPLDIIQSIWMLLKQKKEGKVIVENQYKRLVHPEGNLKSQEVMAQTLEIRPHFLWRGLGSIKHSALKINSDFANWDAEERFEVPGLQVPDPQACQCGEVLKGVIKPWECKVFGTVCTPESPIGSCMVSPEGACAAYFNYGRLSMASQRRELLAAEK